MKCLRFVANLGKFPCSWIRIRIGNADPDLGGPNQCGSMHIRIHNTAIPSIEHFITYFLGTESVSKNSSAEKFFSSSYNTENRNRF
jgi:hypothetical protein